MRIHYVQHVPFETPEMIAVWAQDKGHEVTSQRLFENDPFPSLSDVDMLVVLGGPMGVKDEKEFPWLATEKQLIKEAIQSRTLVLGICLGAQLIAEVIGGEVYKNDKKEIGWFPVHLTNDAAQSEYFKNFPRDFVPFHWHGDTFHLPSEASRIASSPGCINQAFVYGDHVVGLQFHLEFSDTSIQRIIEHCKTDLEQGTYVQQPAEMLGRSQWLEQSNEILTQLLDAMEAKAQAWNREQTHTFDEAPRGSFRNIGD
ncbi:type 1 glutamine amidotransferase [Paenibacillus sp. HWE-109]|uniref:type 1 glutamine amidotransferase n=1 Tax=Paenibacillus sp. HWE-109 TaxID=1306526 RepID=UPI001EDF4462|nr:type 1 glutamine amidotransferase [Paenibacillus sp. HWE-109]UKS29296.1 type 1 glutamine amidotransferase [Paenibacillus sp. HWE-109]